MSRLVAALIATGSILLPAQAFAHLGLTSPVSRYGPDVLKTGPCGVTGGERTTNVSYFEPGETIEVRWEEYIQHPGHYRIAFDEDGVDDFVDPSTMMELYSNEAVLLDGIEDTGESDYRVTVTLPDVTCDRCTLQVVQVMYDKPPYEPGDNDLYYQCADLVLKAGDPPDAGPTPDAGMDDAGSGSDPDAEGGPDNFDGDGDGGSGCRAVAGGGSAGWWLLVFLLWMTRRLARVHRLPL